MHDPGPCPAGCEQVSRVLGLGEALLGQADVDPSGEQTLGIPAALAMPEQHQGGHGLSVSRVLAPLSRPASSAPSAIASRLARNLPAGNMPAKFRVHPSRRCMPVPRRYPQRVATITVHTSPLEQPGTGDAGGLNIYVVEVAKLLAARGVEVDIFTRAVSRDQPPVVELTPGGLVRHIEAGPFEGLDKSDLPGQLCH